MLVTFSTLYDACFMNSARMLAFPPPEPPDPPEPPGEELQAPRASSPAPAADSFKKSRREVVRTSADMALPMESAPGGPACPGARYAGASPEESNKKVPSSVKAFGHRLVAAWARSSA